MRMLSSEIQRGIMKLFYDVDEELQQELGNMYLQQKEELIKELQVEDDEALFKYFLSKLCINEFKWFVLLFIKIIEAQDFDFALHSQVLCDACQQHSKNNLKYDNDFVINIPPGHSKTLICNILYSAWLMGKDPTMKILCRTTTDVMAVETNQKVAAIMTSKAFREIFGDIVLNFTNNKILTITERGIMGYRMSEPMSARVTGESASVVICFPYEQEVLTDKGILQIGDIVENKLNVKVKSWNNDKKRFEWQDIKRYIKNESEKGFEMVEVEMVNGTKIQCTKDHKFLTQRGMVEAKDLLNTDGIKEYDKNY